MNELGEVPSLFMNAFRAERLFGVQRWQIERAALQCSVRFKREDGRTVYLVEDIQRLAERLALAPPEKATSREEFAQLDDSTTPGAANSSSRSPVPNE